jgi:RND family efflux transporter MFP subunit
MGTLGRCGVLVALAMVAIGCSGGEAASDVRPAGGRGGQAPPVPVGTAPVVRKAMPVEIRVIGSAEPHATVAVRAQMTGQLLTAHFTEGDDVTLGQLLFTLDRRPLEAALQQAEANLARNQAQAANAAVQAKRFEDLAARGIATREQVDTARTGVAALNATVEADRAAVDNAKVQLQYATITAPLSGKTGALMVHEGNLVRANDAAPLVVINQVSPMSVSFAIPESRLAELKRFMDRGSLRVTATPPNDDRPPAVGRIAFIDNAVDEESGTIIHRQRGRRRVRHDQDQRDIPQHRPAALARTVRQCRGNADDRSGRDRRALGGDTGRAGRTVRVCRQGRSDRRDAAGGRGADERRRDGGGQRAAAR